MAKNRRPQDDEESEESPLALVPTKELLKELLGRFDQAVFVARKVMRRDGPKVNLNAAISFKGDPEGCLGLCVRAQDMIMRTNPEQAPHPDF